MRKAVAGAALGAVAARAAYLLLTRRPPHEEKLWLRTNHRGEPVTLLEGPAFVAGAVTAVAVAPGVPARMRVAAVFAGTAAGALGVYDDLAGSGDSRGFKGHLSALARGEVTTGAVKILGIGAAGLTAAALAGARGGTAPRRRARQRRPHRRRRQSANLFDLRPGRAIKVGALAALPGTLSGSAVAASPFGAAVALLPEDLGERAMLGDSGANALGALLGLSAARLPLGVRLVLLAGVDGAQRRQRGGQLHQGDPGDAGAAVDRPARPPSRRRAGGAPDGHGVTAAEVTDEPAASRTGRELAGAAVLIGVITILARIAGFGRVVVFSQTVKTSCLGQAYYTANQVPNIVFEIVAGGALAGMVVPVLAGPVERGDHEHVRRTASALLTWMAVALVPLSLLGMLLARPIMSAMVRGGLHECSRDGVVTVGTHMLVVFAPQIALYGFAVVLYGVLQAHRRFTGPALAPLVSSLVVIGAYLAYVPLGHGHQEDLAALPRAAELMLSLGTTAGVLVLLVTAGLAAVRLRLRIRPTLRFPQGTAVRVRRLAIAGLATVAAQQLSAIAVVMLSGHGTRGALADYQYAWALFLLPWAVLAVPIATSAFPMLSARIGTGDTAEFDRDHRLDHPRDRARVLRRRRGAGRSRRTRRGVPRPRRGARGAVPRGARLRSRPARLRPGRAPGPGAVRLSPGA